MLFRDLVLGLLIAAVLVPTAAASEVVGHAWPGHAYDYDAPSAATTPPAQARIYAPEARRDPLASSGVVRLVSGSFLAAKAGTRTPKAILDATGKVHGPLPKPGDLGKYDPEDLARLRDELQQSVQKRIEKTVQLGSDYGHSERLAEEQALIRSIEKHLADR